MITWAYVWLLIFAAAALLFFGAALVITIVGTRDLKDLLAPPGRSRGKS